MIFWTTCHIISRPLNVVYMDFCRIWEINGRISLFKSVPSWVWLRGLYTRLLVQTTVTVTKWCSASQVSVMILSYHIINDNFAQTLTWTTRPYDIVTIHVFISSIDQMIHSLQLLVESFCWWFIILLFTDDGGDLGDALVNATGALIDPQSK